VSGRCEEGFTAKFAKSPKKGDEHVHNKLAMRVMAFLIGLTFQCTLPLDFALVANFAVRKLSKPRAMHMTARALPLG
jgi:hypothetical protein